MIGLAQHWRHEVAAAPATISNSVVAIATAPRVGSADTASPPSADRRAQRCQQIQS
jgi:hypothetical protein